MASPLNRLSNAKSPYLLQYASSLVDWYIWGEEAFLKAKEENKLIFLSVGYSACHWCQLMDRETFANEGIARMMNGHFVNIKVDKEERPDVETTYAAFLQSFTGGFDFPISVFLTPDLKPVYGSTFIAPDDTDGRMGFRSVMISLLDGWTTNESKCIAAAERILVKMAQHHDRGKIFRNFEGRIPEEGVTSRTCYTQISKQYAPEFGGFGGPPKFSQPSNFNFFFALVSAKPDSGQSHNALAMCCHTLRMMAKGGIHDHVGQGFARYAVDKRWHVPRFEKMLYEQGQLLVSYLEAYLATQDAFFANVARGIVSYVTRVLLNKEGGFYSAEDADSLPSKDAQETKNGAFYVWTMREIKRILNFYVPGHDTLSAAEVFIYHYDVKKDGNVSPQDDPRNELKGQNVLFVSGSVENTGRRFNISPAVVEECLEMCRKSLFEERNQRPRPHIDDKFITAWNGLMMSGLAIAGSHLHDPTITEYAVQAANFIKAHLYDQDKKKLLRSCYREGESITNIPEPIYAFSEDYAFTIQGLLDLYEACFDVQWIDWADELQERMNQLFWDTESAGYYLSESDDTSIVLRLKAEQDGAEPSANSVAVRNLLKLASYLDKPEYRNRASQILAQFSVYLTRVPLAVPELVRGLMMYCHSAVQIAIVGRRGSADTDALLRAVHSILLPNKIVLFRDPDDEGIKESCLYERLAFYRHLKMENDVATAYVRHNYSCKLPVTTPGALKKLLEEEVRE